MNELYEYMTKKLHDRYENGHSDCSIDFEHFEKLYKLVCIVKQIGALADELKRYDKESGK